MALAVSTENRSFSDESPVVTVTDVAREAGVSVSTVSRIVNGTARVAVDKRLAVEAAIARMDFRPNLHARSLKMGRSMTIGMLAQDVESPFFTRVIRGIEDGLKGSGYAPIIVSGHWNQTEEIERVGLLMARRIDGLVILNGSLSDEQIVEISRRQPVVATGRRLEGRNLKTLRLDNEQGGYMATSHLLSLGTAASRTSAGRIAMRTRSTATPASSARTATTASKSIRGSSFRATFSKPAVFWR